MRRTRREDQASRKGKWSPRGTGTTVLTHPCPSQPLTVTVRRCARVTGKAGEHGQNSGEMGGCSPWTGPSAPRCGDTLKAYASYGLDLGEETDKKTNDLQTRLSEARNLERYVRSVEAKRKAKVGHRKAEAGQC